MIRSSQCGQCVRRERHCEFHIAVVANEERFCNGVATPMELLMGMYNITSTSSSESSLESIVEFLPEYKEGYVV